MAEQGFGRYELRGVLGEGGFARVYRALDPALGREVALKTLLPWQAADAEIRRRFLAEAQALAALRHANIVTVYDVGEADGLPFFAMELVEGRSLAQLIAQEGAQPLGRAVELLRALGSAVAYLHGAGIVHRDIKPANIMVEPGGRPVLMDFGIARNLDATQHTQTGVSIGTPAYMAPEQVRGETVGPPADVYALGVVAYQLLAGRPPFEGDTAHVLHAQVYEPPPPLATLRPDLPPSVIAAVQISLAKQPEQRPRAGAIAALLAGEQTPTQLVTPLPSLAAAPTMLAAPLGCGRGLLITLSAAAAVLVLVAGLTIALVPRGSHGANSGNTAAPPVTAATVLAALGSVAPSASVPVQATPLAGTTPPAPPTPRTAFAGAARTVTPAAATPTATQPFDATFASTGDDAAWAAGRAPWSATLAYQNGPANAAVVMRIVPSAAQDNALAQSPITPLGSDAGTIGLSLPTVGTVPAGNYLVRIFLVQGGVWKPAGSRGLAVAPPAPPPTAPPTAQPTASPMRPPARQSPAPLANTALHAGNWARANTPGDCLTILSVAGNTASKLDCAWDGSDAYLLDGPIAAGGEQWWHVRAQFGASQETGYARAAYLASGSAPVTPNVAGTYTMQTDMQYGQSVGESDEWAVSLSQNGTQVNGSAVLVSNSGAILTLAGEMTGRVLHVHYHDAKNTGEFWWSFSSDGSRFAGAYDYVVDGFDSLGGTSYGARQGANVSTQPQATVFVVGMNAANGVVARGQTVYVCATVSAVSSLTITAQPSQTLYAQRDDGTGVCQAEIITPDPDGSARFSAIMSNNSTGLAGGNVIVSVR